ncbi:CoA transferase [Gordonia polyisoprenivorans]|uniref:CoA transferase n=1 Tax=Gordonia polyisoprenivorans TaxID=84595 RepID=UPI001AD67030|nr:CoA transferase [Gordonia polyisoprenivorans]QTI71014.1 CoA transferase [Gordonia polyisoprenivorans]
MNHRDGDLAAAEQWARSGLAYLTGLPEGPPDFSCAMVLAEAQRRLDEFWKLMRSVNSTRDGWRVEIDCRGFDRADVLLSGRAGLLGWKRRGQISAGGGTHLIQAFDEWFALTLARPDDIAAVPALLLSDENADQPAAMWEAVERAARSASASYWVERARLLGIPSAVLGEAAANEPLVVHRSEATAEAGYDPLLVVDLASMWAGPLATRLLSVAGATVVKVETRSRPDGTRVGDHHFFDWMNSGKLSKVVDFDRDGDKLRQLLSVADVVVEGSRPAALRRRGLDAKSVSPRPGQVWVRLTAHGVHGPPAEWVGFGDDAAVAGGLVAGTREQPVFCGDAIADPLTGIETAAAIARAIAIGRACTIDISLAATAARYARFAVAEIADRSLPAVRAPVGPAIVGSGPRLGVDDSFVDDIVRKRIRG